MESLAAFNEEPRAIARRLCCLSPGTPEFLLAKSFAPHNGNREFQPIAEGSTMPAKKLSDAEISALLPKAKGWSVANGKLHREFACKDFRPPPSGNIDACRSRRRSHEPPSGMVQRLEQSGD